MAAFTASQASVTNGSKIVTINSGESIANIRQGDFLFLAGFLVEINRGYVGAASQQYIELVKNWANSNQSSQPAVVIPTTGDFRAAVDAINNANKNVNDNFVAMQNWQTNMGTVTFVNQDGTTTTVKTLKQIEADNEAQMDAYHPFPWAMRKVEFEDRRAVNNQKYAASGFVYKGNHGGGAGDISIDQGLHVNSGLVNTIRIGRPKGKNPFGKSKSYFPVLNLAGHITELNGGYTYSGIDIKFPAAEDGTRTYDSATGVPVTHATPAIAFASETATNKVVTDRVDMWGILQIEQEINDSYPFVYPNGLPQSLAATMNGVATTTNNIQPIEYFAQYAGDTSIRGKGVNWQAATEAQRITLANDPKNKIYFNDATGKFYQTHNFALSFFGLGNGDWSNIDAITGDLAFSAQSKLVPEIAVNATKFTAGTEVGVFTANNNPDCHFLVCGTVNRRNRGFYHDSFNKPGAAKASDDKDWSQTSVSFTSKADCFDPTKLLAGSGSIASGKSSAPDGRFYDAIYASGAGGVCRDMRYSAWGLKAEDFAEADLAIKTGEYRGCEKLIKTIPWFESVTGGDISSTVIGSRYVNNVILNKIIDGFANTYTVVNSATNEIKTYVNLPSNVRGNLYYPSAWGANVDIYIVYPKILGVSVAANFTHTDVQGSISQILLCDDLKNGWNGGWLHDFPDSVKDEFELTRLYTGTGIDITRTHTLDNGAAWTSAITAIGNSPKNTVTVTNMPANQVTIWQYKTKANLTQVSVSTDVYGDDLGLGSVFFSQDHDVLTGALLAYSLVFKILKTNTNVPTVKREVKRLISHDILLGKLKSNGYGGLISYSPITLTAPQNNSPGFKALNYNVVENQQAFINYAYTELTHNGIDWGDDSKIHIIDNQSTMLDENGNTVLVGTARCVEPLGWIKNDK